MVHDYADGFVPYPAAAGCYEPIAFADVDCLIVQSGDAFDARRRGLVVVISVH